MEGNLPIRVQPSSNLTASFAAASKQLKDGLGSGLVTTGVNETLSEAKGDLDSILYHLTSRRIKFYAKERPEPQGQPEEEKNHLGIPSSAGVNI